MRTICGITVSLLLLLAAQSVLAQSDRQKARDNVNNFGRFLNEKNADSAFYNGQELAGRNVDLLNNLMHDSFARYFLEADADTTLLGQLLGKMYTTTGNRPLQQSVYPLYRWVEVSRNLNNPAKIRQVVTGFLTAQTRSPEEKDNRIDRYALLIYKLLKQKAEYGVLADTLFNRTQARLQHACNGVYYQAAEDRKLQEARLYFRYLIASANHIKAEEALQQNDLVKVEAFRKAASAFTPDENDRLVKTFTFCENAFLFGGQEIESFHQPYIEFLLTKRDTAAAVGTLTELTLADPGTITMLKTYYAKAPVSGLAFQDYWMRTLNAKLKPAEPFRLIDLGGKTFDYKQYKGKWVLIDFWGTWCKPCLEELPRFQKFYTEFAQSHQQKLVVLTVACSDTEPRVVEFMKKQAYTFPVAMANNTIEKAFRVVEYPTKVLITPQGNRMKIPFGANWTERVKIYMENE